MMKKASVSLTREAVSLEAATSRKWMFILGALGVVGLGLSAVGFASDRAQFYHSYLVAFIFCLSLALGSLFFVILQHVVGAHWSVVVRRIAENVMASMPVLVVLLIPLLFGLHDLYHWTHHDAVAHDQLLQAKEPYLNLTFFGVRVAIYFAFWLIISQVFYRRSLAVDETGDIRTVQWMRTWSAPSILVYALTQTFAAFDLIMSLDPHWYSTMFGVYYFAGSIVSTFSFIALLALLLRWGGKLRNEITPEHYHDLGKLMFAFTVFWTYIAFSQYFLIWYSNIPEETIFFKHRWEGSWKTVSMLIVLGHFVVPFAVLMSKHVKRTLPLMGVMTVWMIFMHLVDMYWLVMPNLHKEGMGLHWLDITCVLGVCGAFGAMIARRFGQGALVPVRDPYLVRSLEFENV